MTRLPRWPTSDPGLTRRYNDAKRLLNDASAMPALSLDKRPSHLVVPAYLLDGLRAGTAIAAVETVDVQGASLRSQIHVADSNDLASRERLKCGSHRHHADVMDVMERAAVSNTLSQVDILLKTCERGSRPTTSGCYGIIRTDSLSRLQDAHRRLKAWSDTHEQFATPNTPGKKLQRFKERFEYSVALGLWGALECGVALTLPGVPELFLALGAVAAASGTVGAVVTHRSKRRTVDEQQNYRNTLQQGRSLRREVLEAAQSIEASTPRTVLTVERSQSVRDMILDGAQCQLQNVRAELDRRYGNSPIAVLRPAASEALPAFHDALLALHVERKSVACTDDCAHSATTRAMFERACGVESVAARWGSVSTAGRTPEASPAHHR